MNSDALRNYREVKLYTYTMAFINVHCVYNFGRRDLTCILNETQYFITEYCLAEYSIS